VSAAPLRIDYVTSGFVWAPGGNHRVVYEHANRLRERGHAVRVLHPPDSAAPSRKDAGRAGWLAAARGAGQRLRKRWTPARPTWFELAPGVEVAKLRSLGPDEFRGSDVLVAANWNVAGPLYGAATALGIPLVQIAHHYEVLSGYPAAEVDRALALPVPKVAVSRWTRECLEAAGFGPVEYAANGVDPRLYRVVRPPDERGLVVCANYTPKAIKDPATLFGALERVAREVPGVEVVLFGGSRSAPRLPFPFRYVARASNAFIAEEVYNRSAVFVASSRFEGFALPAAEAMACGCAVVSTDCGGIRDFALHGDTALLSPPGDAAALAANTERMLRDRELRRRTVARGLALIATFTWERSAEALERVLLQAVASHPNRRPRG
jgi:glycosyltransferase involved in cell wall biosynthesis